MRQPAIEKVFDIEVNSTVTSIAPGTCSIEGGGFVVVEIDLGISEIRKQDQIRASSRRRRGRGRNRARRCRPSGSRDSR
jgi:hypothetical protein